MRLWTGKQVIGVLIRPNKECHVLVNLETRARTYNSTHGYPIEHMDPGDGFVCIRNSELLSGTLDKNTLGSGSKNNLFHVLMRDYSTEIAADRMGRIAKVRCG